MKMTSGQRVSGMRTCVVLLALFFLLIAVQIRQAASFQVSRPFSPKNRRSGVRLNLNSCRDDVDPLQVPPLSRRSLLKDSSGLLLLLSSTAIPVPAVASEDAATLPKITRKVVFDVRVSRQDGTFYTRGDETDDERKNFSVTMGLFGNAAPTHVERFLSYATRPSAEEISFPSYSQSQFKSFDQATGVLFGGIIPSLELTEFAGSTALKYGGRILPAPLWLERKANDGASTTTEALPLPHSAKGLLIHRKLDAEPVFGITTRSDSGSYVSDFDRDFVAFGKVLEPQGTEFLKFCENLPTYSVERPPQDDNLVQDAAKLVYDKQRDFFRGAAKSFGDTRVAKVFPGKLLRRVEVTKVTVL